MNCKCGYSPRSAESVLVGEFLLASLQDKSVNNIKIVDFPQFETMRTMQNEAFIFFREKFLISICGS
jgi:hypothetical protein